MNKRQRGILYVAFLVLLGMVLFPPWLYVYNPPTTLHGVYVRNERPGGYHLLTRDHTPRDKTELMDIFRLDHREEWVMRFVTLQSFSMRIDGARLAVQITGTLLLASLLYLIVRPRVIR